MTKYKVILKGVTENTEPGKKAFLDKFAAAYKITTARAVETIKQKKGVLYTVTDLAAAQKSKSFLEGIGGNIAIEVEEDTVMAPPPIDIAPPAPSGPDAPPQIDSALSTPTPPEVLPEIESAISTPAAIDVPPEIESAISTPTPPDAPPEIAGGDEPSSADAPFLLHYLSEVDKKFASENDASPPTFDKHFANPVGSAAPGDDAPAAAIPLSTQPAPARPDSSSIAASSPTTMPAFSSSTAAKSCPECGAELPAGVEFCVKCGFNPAPVQPPAGGPAFIAPTPKPSPVKMPVKSPGQKAGSGSALKIVGVIAAAVLLFSAIGVGGGIYLYADFFKSAFNIKNGGDDTDSSDSDAYALSGDDRDGNEKSGLFPDAAEPDEAAVGPKWMAMIDGTPDSFLAVYVEASQILKLAGLDADYIYYSDSSTDDHPDKVVFASPPSDAVMEMIRWRLKDYMPGQVGDIPEIGCKPGSKSSAKGFTTSAAVEIWKDAAKKIYFDHKKKRDKTTVRIISNVEVKCEVLGESLGRIKSKKNAGRGSLWMTITNNSDHALLVGSDMEVFIDRKTFQIAKLPFANRRYYSKEKTYISARMQAGGAQYFTGVKNEAATFLMVNDTEAGTPKVLFSANSSNLVGEWPYVVPAKGSIKIVAELAGKPDDNPGGWVATPLLSVARERELKYRIIVPLEQRQKSSRIFATISEKGLLELLREKSNALITRQWAVSWLAGLPGEQKWKALEALLTDDNMENEVRSTIALWIATHAPEEGLEMLNKVMYDESTPHEVMVSCHDGLKISGQPKAKILARKAEAHISKIKVLITEQMIKDRGPSDSDYYDDDDDSDYRPRRRSRRRRY